MSMSDMTPTKGACGFCGREFTKRGMAPHLKACPEYAKKALAPEIESQKKQSLFLVIIQGRYDKDYWLYLEMNGDDSMWELDHYLPRIWLECCDHLSTFIESGSSRNEVDEDLTVEEAFNMHKALYHLYDFGSTTYLTVTVSKRREGLLLTEHSIALIARNNMPIFPCFKCGKPSAWRYSNWDDSSFKNLEFCHVCKLKHDAKQGDDQGMSPIPNSPRFGVCGYD